MMWSADEDNGGDLEPLGEFETSVLGESSTADDDHRPGFEPPSGGGMRESSSLKTLPAFLSYQPLFPASFKIQRERCRLTGPGVATVRSLTSSHEGRVVGCTPRTGPPADDRKRWKGYREKRKGREDKYFQEAERLFDELDDDMSGNVSMAELAIAFNESPRYERAQFWFAGGGEGGL